MWLIPEFLETTAPGRTASRVFAWNTSGDDDLTFVYHDPTTGQLIDGTVHFRLPENISVGLVGDFNHDGTVDAADYVVWRKNNGGPGDYATWRANFGMTSPGGGSGALALAGSPATGTAAPFQSPLALADKVRQPAPY